MPIVVIYIAAALLLLGAAPLPYGYYTLLRLVATGVFIWAAIISYQNQYKIIPWVFALLAILFNPIIKIYLPKDVWVFIDIGSAIFLLLCRNKIKAPDLESNN